MRDPSDQGPSRVAEDFVRGVRESHDLIDQWIDAALTTDFRGLQSEWEDIRQEVRVRLYQNLSRGRFEGRSSLRTYVHRMTRNVAIDFLRRARRSRETGPLEAIPARLTPLSQAGSGRRVDSRDFLEKILEPFGEEDRLMIALVFEERCSVEEVATRLGIPSGTVKSRVSRLREKILRRRRRLSPERHDAD